MEAREIDVRVQYKICVGKLPPAVRVDSCTAVITMTRDPVLLERALNTRGLALTAVNRFDEAVRDFTAVIKMDPKIAGYYDNRQTAYRGLGALDNALSDAFAAVKLAPKYAFVYRSRGNIYADMDQFDPALADYTTAIGLEPHDAGLLFDRGKILARAKQLERAVDDFTQAYTLDPTIVDALKERGLAYQLLGRTDLALADLERYQLIRPDDIVVADAVNTLKRRAPAPHP